MFMRGNEYICMAVVTGKESGLRQRHPGDWSTKCWHSQTAESGSSCLDPLRYHQAVQIICSARLRHSACGAVKLLPPWQPGAVAPHRGGRRRAYLRPALFVLDPGLLSLRPGAYARQASRGVRTPSSARSASPSSPACSSSRTMSSALGASTPKYSAAGGTSRRPGQCCASQQLDRHQWRRGADRRQADGHPGDAA